MIGRVSMAKEKSEYKPPQNEKDKEIVDIIKAHNNPNKAKGRDRGTMLDLQSDQQFFTNMDFNEDEVKKTDGKEIVNEDSRRSISILNLLGVFNNKEDAYFREVKNSLKIFCSEKSMKKYIQNCFQRSQSYYYNFLARKKAITKILDLCLQHLTQKFEYYAKKIQLYQGHFINPWDNLMEKVKLLFENFDDVIDKKELSLWRTDSDFCQKIDELKGISKMLNYVNIEFKHQDFIGCLHKKTITLKNFEDSIEANFLKLSNVFSFEYKRLENNGKQKSFESIEKSLFLHETKLLFMMRHYREKLIEIVEELFNYNIT